MSDNLKTMVMAGDAKDKDILLDVRNDNPSITEKEDFYDNFITQIEENPTMFYDTSEFEDLGGDGINDGVTQKNSSGIGRMDRGTDEERRRVKTDFSLAIGEMWYGGGRRESDPLFAELKKAGKELEADLEKDFHFEWNIVDVDESHIYVTNKTNGHRYHISVIYPAALYVDVYRILEDGTECKAF